MSKYMEVLLLTAVGALGWALSKPGALGTQTPAPVIASSKTDPWQFAQQTKTSHDLFKDHEARAKKRWQDARDPAMSGIIDPQNPMVRPFRALKSQSTNPDLSQRRMELFNGGDSVWQHKQERTQLFEPDVAKQSVSSGGGAGTTIGYDPNRYSVTNLQNNTLPFQQQRVGPGVNVGTNVDAADGFHSQYRPELPDLGFKKNTLEGRVNPGSSAVAAREIDPKFYSKGVPRIWDMERRPLEKGMATVTAQRVRPETSVKGQARCHVDGEEYYGVAKHGSHTVHPGAWDRLKLDNNPGLPLTNATGARVGTGGFTSARYDTSKIQAQQRETPQKYLGPVAGDQYRHTSSQTYDVAPTFRDMQNAGYGNQTVGIVAGHYIPTVPVSVQDTPRTTLRENMHDDTNGFAPAEGGTRMGHMVQCTNRQLLKESKRGSQVVNMYVNHAERTDALRRAHGLGDVRRCEGAVALRRDDHVGRVTSHGAAGSMYMNQAFPGVATTASMNKLPSDNKFQQYNLAKTVLANNPYHQNIN